MNVVISPNPYRDKQFRHALRAREILEASGVKTSMCLPFDTDKNFELPDGVKLLSSETAMENCDMMVCLGGDGTILHTSRLAAQKGIPVLGINIGTLGFMAELEPNELTLLSRLADADYSIEERMMLEVSVNAGNSVLFTDHALNDAVITKGAVARTVQMKVSCNNSEVLNCSGDGVIISTPTGSTAYSLSAGGPIVEPTAKNMLITPICAHGNNFSSFVTESSHVISVSIEKIGRRNAFLSVDGGKAFRLDSDNVVNIRRSDRVTKLVRLKEHDFFKLINKKFLYR